jgi:hypothetical protein
MSDETRAVERAAARRRVQIAVTVVIEGDEAEYRGTTVDLSPQGLRLESEAVLVPGQPVGLVLATQPEYIVKARVVWVGRADSTLAGQAGFEFVNPAGTAVS